MLLLPVVLDQFSNNRSFGMPEDQTAARVFLDGKQVQVAAQHAVVPPLGLRLPQIEHLQLLCTLPRGAVDALQRQT